MRTVLIVLVKNLVIRSIHVFLLKKTFNLEMWPQQIDVAGDEVYMVLSNG